MQLEGAASSTAGGVELLPMQVSAVASPSGTDGHSALFTGELYSLGKGRELFDLLHERRGPAGEHGSCRMTQQMVVYQVFPPNISLPQGHTAFSRSQGLPKRTQLELQCTGLVKEKNNNKDHTQKHKLEGMFFHPGSERLFKEALKATT